MHKAAEGVGDDYVSSCQEGKKRRKPDDLCGRGLCLPWTVLHSEQCSHLEAKQNTIKCTIENKKIPYLLILFLNDYHEWENISKLISEEV